MNQHTIDKIRVYGTNEREWKEALLAEIDADQLPACYGGTLTDADGDPVCPSQVIQSQFPIVIVIVCVYVFVIISTWVKQITWGRIVPQSYYTPKSKPKIQENMECLTLARGSKKRVELPIQVAGSIIR